MSSTGNRPKALDEYPSGFISAVQITLRNEVKPDCTYKRWCRLGSIVLLEDLEEPGIRGCYAGIRCEWSDELCGLRTQTIYEHLDALLPEMLDRFNTTEEAVPRSNDSRASTSSNLR